MLWGGSLLEALLPASTMLHRRSPPSDSRVLHKRTPLDTVAQESQAAQVAHRLGHGTACARQRWNIKIGLLSAETCYGLLGHPAIHPSGGGGLQKAEDEGDGGRVGTQGLLG